MEIKKVLLIIVKKKNFLQYFRPWNGVEVGEDAMQKSREEKKKKKKKDRLGAQSSYKSSSYK